MRVRRALAVGLLALTGGVTLVALATPALAQPSGQVTLDSTSGPPDTQITAMFQLSSSPGQGCGTFKVIFRWDNHQVGARNLDHCAASVPFIPPKDLRKPGRHVVTVTDDKPLNIFGWTSFLIVLNNPSPSRSSGSPTASPSAGKPRTAKPTASVEDTDPAIVDPPTATDTTPAVDPSVTPAAAAGSGGGDGSSALGIALAFGGALMLGGVGILGYVIWRGRRGEPEYALTESTELTESTDQMPTFPGGFTPQDGTGYDPPAGNRPPYSPPPPVPE